MGQDEISERGVLTASDELWEVAVGQAAVISRLAAFDTVGATAVDQAADELGPDMFVVKQGGRRPSRRHLSQPTAVS